MSADLRSPLRKKLILDPGRNLPDYAALFYSAVSLVSRILLVLFVFSSVRLANAQPANAFVHSTTTPPGDNELAGDVGALFDFLDGLSDKLINLDQRWHELEARARWQLRTGTAAQLVGSIRSGIETLAGVLDPLDVFPRLGLQVYRTLPQLPVPGPMTSAFGFRSDPFGRDRQFHHGIDFRGKRGTPVRASAAGTVRVAKRINGYGNIVIIDHGLGLETRYAHLSRLLVKADQFVDAGHVIGRVGATGRATGPHLHFEVRHNGQAFDPRFAFVDDVPRRSRRRNRRNLSR